MPKTNTDYENALEILIVDDHVMLRDGLKMMLNGASKEQKFLVTEADGTDAAMRQLAKKDFDLVILDYQMPGNGGAEAVYRMLRYKANLLILTLSNYDELPYIQSMMEAGARGYVLKSIEPRELLRAIRTVLEGKLYYSSDVAVKLIDAAEKKPAVLSADQYSLTERETEVLKYIALEYTNDEIAALLHVSKRTVDTHRQNLLNKLRVKNTAGLVKVALRLGLITLN